MPRRMGAPSDAERATASRPRPSWAVLLLAVLLSHLALMASPFHHSAEVGREPGRAAAATVYQAAPVDRGGASDTPSIAATHGAPHCAIESSLLPAGSFRLVAADLVPSSLPTAPEPSVAPCDRLASARPPPVGDAQAVLQVFRI